MSGHWEHKDGKPVWISHTKEDIDPVEKELANAMREYQLPTTGEEIREVQSYIMSVIWNREEDEDEEEKLIEYTVDFSKVEYYSASVTVKAKDEDDAKDKAYEIIGNSDIDWSYDEAGDIEITDVS